MSSHSIGVFRAPSVAAEPLLGPVESSLAQIGPRRARCAVDRVN